MFTEEYEAISHNGKLTPVNGYYGHLFIHKLVEKLNKGLAPTIAIVGKQGNGKSIGAMRLAEILYYEVEAFEGEFHPERNLCYEPLEYAKLMADIDIPVERNEDGEVIPDEDKTVNEDREVLIVDEAGVNLNVLDHHDSFNRSVDELLQTQRVSNCLSIFVLPAVGSLDSRVKDNLDFIVEFVDIGKAKIMGLSFQHGRLGNKNRVFIPYSRLVGLWEVDMVEREHILQEYRQKEYSFKDNLPEEIVENLEEEKREEEEEAIDLDELI